MSDFATTTRVMMVVKRPPALVDEATVMTRMPTAAPTAVTADDDE